MTDRSPAGRPPPPTADARPPRPLDPAVPPRRVEWIDLGRRPYAPVWDLQHRLVEARKGGGGADTLLLVEHDAVLTLGRRAQADHVLRPAAELAAAGIDVQAVERGGDVTYHGPGQLVAYPILDLHGFRPDVRWYSLSLLEVVVRTLAAFGIAGEVRTGLETGVWVRLGPRDGAISGPHEAPLGKVAALGVRIERWITYHGVALNVDPTLAHFDWIVPCGLSGVITVSMASLLGRPIELAEVRPAFLAAFASVFATTLVEGTPPAIDPNPITDAALGGDRG
ncbi:MAG: lipoyl(octanoyl) transferase LipB [Ardenticatenales bacterium]